MYESIYSNPETRARWKGSILVFYLMIYGAVRIILEIFRKERKIAFSLTHAQLVMTAFLVAGLALFLIIKCKGGRLTEKGRSETDAGMELNKLFSLAGFLVSYLSLFFIIYFITKRVHILPWPFQKATTIAGAYAHIAYYLPFMSIPGLSVIWLKKIDVPFIEKFTWNKFSKVFFICLAISIYYSIELLIIRKPKLREPEFRPPIILVCILNALAEEITYRLAFYDIFHRIAYSIILMHTSKGCRFRKCGRIEPLLDVNVLKTI
jgi:hypothetical protein